MPRTPVIAGNWKSNPKSLDNIKELCLAFNETAYDSSKVEVVICPTALHCEYVANLLKEAGRMKVGVQNVSKHVEGAFTGEITASMVKLCGFEWAIIGHSERRGYYDKSADRKHDYYRTGETDEELAKKVELAQAVAGLHIMFCVGETIEERNAGNAKTVIEEQIKWLTKVVTDWSRVVIAYEPVWAIGAGTPATVQVVVEMHADIRKFLSSVSSQVSQEVRILYGGSVKPSNCTDLLRVEDVDGFLVGGASLEKSFMDIVNAAAIA